MLSNFIYAKTKALFEEKLNAGEILDEAVVFIEDTREIWNHGKYFATPMTESEVRVIAQDVVNESIIMALNTAV